MALVMVMVAVAVAVFCKRLLSRCVFVLFVFHTAENITLSLRTFTPSSFYSAELLLFSNCVIQINKLIIVFFFCVELLCVGAGCL
jgi:hypothetical protein